MVLLRSSPLCLVAAFAFAHGKPPRKPRVQAARDARRRPRRHGRRGPRRRHGTGAPSPAPTANPDAGRRLEAKTLDGGTRVFSFGEVEVEGRLRSPQIVYFLRRVRAEFAAGDLGHRAFMGELSDTRHTPSFHGGDRHRHGYRCRQSARVLRVAAVWGTTVVVDEEPDERRVVRCSVTSPSAAIPIPFDLDMSSAPVRAAAGGWEVDARASLAGMLKLRGRDEDPVAFGQSGAPIPIVPGDLRSPAVRAVRHLLPVHDAPRRPSTSAWAPGAPRRARALLERRAARGRPRAPARAHDAASHRQAARAHQPGRVRGALRSQARHRSKSRRRPRPRRRQGRRIAA